MSVDDKAASPHVHVAILNWNGWGDTIECLESVLRSDYPSYQVIVLDNGSEDGSIEHIKAWADGRLDVARPTREPLSEWSFPPVSKPIIYMECERDELEAGRRQFSKKPALIILRNGANLGFAAGYNVVLRQVLRNEDVDYCWLLNNDTIIQSDALSELVRGMRAAPRAGLAGVTLLYYDAPDVVQALGGATYNKWLGTHQHIGNRTHLDDQTLNDAAIERIEAQTSYPVGASIMVSRQYLRDVGLMSEDYFLYFEEIDWAVRGRGLYSLAYAPRSIVYHREGGSVKRQDIAPFADYIALRNRLLFTRKQFPWALPVVWVSFLGVLFNRLQRGQFDRLGTILKIMCGRWRFEK